MQPLRRIELEGTPAAMGRKYGEALQLEIETLYQRRLQNALEQAKGLGNALASEEQLLEVAAACCEATAAFDPDGFSELEGIAPGQRSLGGTSDGHEWSHRLA